MHQNKTHSSGTTKPFTKEEKRVAIKLWKAKVSLATIRAQMKMSERSLRRILAFAKVNPESPVSERKKNPGSGKYKEK